MSKSVTSKAHQKQLALINSFLEEEGWPMSAQPPETNNPYHRITADILSEDDDTQVLWQIELSLMPIPAVNLPDVSILQCFVPLANQFTTLLKPQLFEMLVRINTKLPLVGFGFLEDFNLLYFKHNLMLSNDFQETDGLILNESLTMMAYLVATFTDAIVEVATGQKDIASVIDELRHRNLLI